MNKAQPPLPKPPNSKNITNMSADLNFKIKPLSKEEKTALTISGKEAVQASKNPKLTGGFQTIINDQGGHLIYELIQNAEDTVASEIKIELHKNKLEFWHNGQSFTYTNIDSLTSLGNSDKVDNTSTIGKFGFGFKSVFSITEKPIIKCDNCCFEIQDIFCPIFLPNEDTKGWTKLIFEFIEGKESKIYKDLEVELQNDISDRSVLFLSNIRKIDILIPSSQTKVNICKKIVEMIKFKELEVCFSKNELTKTRKYLYFEDKFDYNDKKIDFGVCYEFEKSKDVYNFIKIKNTNNLSVYFPTKDNFSLSFYVNGGFVIGSSRENCVLRNEFNQKLFDSIQKLIFKSILTFRDLNVLNLSFLELFTNLESQSAIYDFNESLHKIIQNTLEKEKIIPVENPQKYELLKNCARLSKDILKFFNENELIKYNFDKSFVNIAINDKQELKKFLEGEGLICYGLFNLISTIKLPLYEQKDETWFENLYSFIAKEGNEEWLELVIIKLDDGKFCSGNSKIYLGQNDYSFELSKVKTKGFNILNEFILKETNSKFLKFLRNNCKVYNCFEILKANPDLIHSFDNNKLVQLYKKLINKRVNWSEVKIIKTSQNKFISGSDTFFNPFVATLNFSSIKSELNILNELFRNEKEIIKYFDEERGFNVLSVSDALLMYPNLIENYNNEELSHLYKYLFLSGYDHFNEKLKIIKLEDNNFISCEQVREVYIPNPNLVISENIKILNKVFFKESNKDVLKKLEGYFDIKEFDELDNILKIVIPRIGQKFNFVENIVKIENILKSESFRNGDKIEIKEELKKLNFLPLLEIDGNGETIFSSYNQEFYKSFDKPKYHFFSENFSIYKLNEDLISKDSIVITECCNHYYEDFILFQSSNQHTCKVLKDYIETEVCNRQISQTILDHLADYVENKNNKLDKYRYLLNQHAWLINNDTYTRESVRPGEIKLEECGLEIPESVIESRILEFIIEKEFSDQTKSEIGEENIQLINFAKEMDLTLEEAKDALEKARREKDEKKRTAKLAEEMVSSITEESQNIAGNISYTNNMNYINPEQNKSRMQKEKIKSTVDQIWEEAPDETIEVKHHTRSKSNFKIEGKSIDKYYNEKNNIENDMTEEEKYIKFEESQDQKYQNKIVGDKGEEIVYNYLCNQYGLENVTWNNQYGESGISWDLEVETESTTIFFEVKSKINSSPRKCYLTSGEWQRAKSERDNFIILILILKDNTITYIKDPYQRWLDEEIEVNPLQLTY